MPYINHINRNLFDSHIEKLSDAVVVPGELNYIFTRLCDNYINDKKCYDSINAAIGALECAKQELYRRVAAPFENEKWHSNGDVYIIKGL